MASYILLALAAWIIYYFTKIALSLKKNVAMAEESGLPYIVLPVYLFNRPWMIVHKPIIRLLSKLPIAIRPTWLPHARLNQSWNELSSQYDGIETKTYLTVSPWGFLCWVANAEAINQITTRRNDFPKPIHIYRAIDIFGKNVVSTEGHLWRRHRKVTSPPFTEKNNHLVWTESIHQADSMMKSWTGMDGNESRTINEVAHDCMRLSLHVISRAGFGVRLLWPGIETDSAGIEQTLEAGHKMTYTDALEGLLHSLIAIIAIGPKILPRLPFKFAQKAYLCFVEWRKYMSEMVEAKKIELSQGKSKDGGMDLMGQLVKSAGYGSDSKIEKGEADYLTDDEIMGNAFVFILAGHETTANTIHYALLLLAMEVAEQRKMQKDIDSIFGGRKPSKWDYDQDLPRLFGGMVGAVMNETLRLIPPVISIPKSTQTWQSLTIDGKQYKVPPNTHVNLSTAIVHRDSRYWPAGPSLPKEENWHPTSNHGNDLNEFRPSRWLLAEGNTATAAMPSRDLRNAEAEDIGVNTAADTAETLFKPPKGAYIPFSEGFRSCIGRRFAQVEVLVVLALIMSQWSVEFAVDEWASDEEVAQMTEDEKYKLWRKARHQAREKWRTKMGTVITIKLVSGNYIPLRFVRRGKERFNFV